MRCLSRIGKAVLATAICLVFSASSHASFHLWQIVEVYSNASGSVQYIEMNDLASGENLLNTAGANISSGTHNFLFDHDLVGNTANKRVLLATPGYFALSGVPTPDYNLGVNNFFSLSADTVNFDGLNTFVFSAGQLPSNGFNSLNRTYNGSAITSAVSSPTNFAGQSGTLPEPATILFAMPALLLFRRRLS